jgi:hypothetical protein
MSRYSSFSSTLITIHHNLFRKPFLLCSFLSLVVVVAAVAMYM